MEIRALGQLELAGGDDRRLGGAKPSMLLAALLVSAGRSVSVDRLELTMWGDDPPNSSVHAIQVYVSKLRRALTGVATIERDGDGYRLVVGRDEYDVHRFEDLIASAEADDDPGRRADALREAMDLWRGRPFGSLADNSEIRVESQRLEMLRDDAVERLFEAELARGHHAAAATEIEEALARSPLREGLWRLLMIALYRSGRQAEALRAFGRLRRVLGEELGIEPSPESGALERQVLLHDAALDLADAARGNLPSAPTSFVGRSAEAEMVADSLRRNRIVTLHGPPGVGKSRLAVEVAADLQSQFEVGCFLVDVAESDTEEVLEAAIARVLGITQRIDNPLDAVADRVGDGAVLLVLDGCEFLADHVGRIVDALISRCRRLRVLATSTVALDIAGESLVRIEPLEPAEARALFEERSEASGGDLLDSDEAVVGEICARLEGIPLAIELAAARTAVLAPPQILERIGDPEFLGGNRRTLGGALEWTVSLLPRPAEQAFERLSVFRDGFGLEGAEALIDSASPLDDVMELARHSLLGTERRGGEIRYTMLDAVRRHAEQRLVSSGLADDVRRRHADHVRELARRADRGLNGPDQLDWLVRLDSELGNIRAALGFFLEAGEGAAALDLGGDISWFWFLRSHLQEGWYWLGQLLAATESERSIPRVRTLVRASQFAWELAANAQARQWLDEAAELAEELESEVHAAWAAAHMALLDIIDGQDETASSRAAEARRVFEERGNFVGYGFSVFVESLAPILPAFRADRPDPEEVRRAIVAMERLAEGAHAAGERNLIGHAEFAVGTLKAFADEIPSGRDHLRSGARSLIELGNLACLSHVLDALALLESEAGRPRSAASVLGMVTRLRDETGAPGHDFERLLHDRARQGAIAGVGAEAFDAELERGAQMPLDEILAFAWEGGEQADAIGE